ncbi:glycosyl hydrolase [Saccharothrix sp. ALI-22-I]|uniref:WD40/YVTN/BNR-like repeat-containing protein n=1 Tax=Saccharothrix sp. ALI-22-I TaxID=1933778 RepID=UPI00097BAAC5|nr:glycosyl hydrolase [Saccharothrix sp. ALI-22-I]ONI85565.1 glycosyl hydrolase [Saccharothrix sp. ALI-22-I]
MHLLAIGTRKGLWLATSEDRKSWSLSGPHHAMTEVYAIAIDARRDRPKLLVGTSSSHFGPTVVTSDDLGATWDEPDHAPIAFPEDASLERVWQLALTPDPEVVYAGTQPSALFRSEDGGRTFSLVEGLWKHPHREQWGAGFGGQAIHTVLPDPDDPQRLTVAMSTGGVYRTFDGGASWEASNTGIKAYFLPDPYPEFGQCVHKVSRHPSRPERLFLQNHHGVYRSDDSGETWTSIADGLPADFGFAMVNHPHKPDVIYNFPLAADGDRFPPEGKCAVYRSPDAGASWEALRNGLPDGFWTAVMRDAMCTDTATPAGVYFGSRSGEVYGSADEGESWQKIAEHLPDVVCVRAAEV